MNLAAESTVEAAREGAAGSGGGVMGNMGVTFRSLVIAILLTILAGFWIQQAEIVVFATQISESVPTIPGLAALILLLPLNFLIGQFGGGRIRPLSRAEIIVIFLFVTVSTTIMGPGIMRFLIALIGAPFYFPSAGGSAILRFLPTWLVPQDSEAMRQLYERSPGGVVPWHAWALPGVVWLGFFVTLWWTTYCLMALFHRAWSEEERLTFPLVALPLEICGGGEGDSGLNTGNERTPFFRNPWMWSGFALAAAYNLLNMFHALHPAFPPVRGDIDLPTPDSPPWSAVGNVTFYFRPELIGLGYLVPTDISLTVWLSFLMLKLEAVFGLARGYVKWPYPQDQGLGGYLVLAALLVWNARRHLAGVWRDAVSGGTSAGGERRGFLSHRGLLIGLFGGFLALWAFMVAAGMAPFVTFAFLAIILAVALVYGRIRAEVGAPSLWLFPYGLQKNFLLCAFGTSPFSFGHPSTLPVWGLFSFLSRGYFPELSGYQIEAMEFTRRVPVNAKRMALGLVLAVVVGVAGGWYFHLVPYYHYGAQQLRDGIWGTDSALGEYSAVVHYSSVPKPVDIPRLTASGVGGLTILVLFLLRISFVRFPLNPLGYVMGCSFGPQIWGSFFVVWLLKTLVLRYAGGIVAYRRTVPLFLGLALGHFAVAGIVWGLGGTWAGDAVSGYPVYFG